VHLTKWRNLSKVITNQACISKSGYIQPSVGEQICVLNYYAEVSSNYTNCFQFHSYQIYSHAPYLI